MLGELERKSFFFDRKVDDDAELLIRRIGGYVPRGGGETESGPSSFDDVHLARAIQLIHDDAEPESAAERDAIDRFREKHD